MPRKPRKNNQPSYEPLAPLSDEIASAIACAISESGVAQPEPEPESYAADRASFLAVKELLINASPRIVAVEPGDPLLEVAQRQRDPFAFRDAREAAIVAAARDHGNNVTTLASEIGIDYSDLRAWARDRGLGFAKGKSLKVERIEKALNPQ